MIEQISNFFNMEMIYLWLNFGVLPFWIILIFFPQSNLCRYFVTSIFPYLIFSSVYVFLIIEFYKDNYNFVDNFSLYLGLDSLNNLFDNNYFLITFWVHFLAINLFCGSWIVKDSLKLTMPKFLVFFSINCNLFYWTFRYIYLLVHKNFFRKKNFYFRLNLFDFKAAIFHQ